MGNNACGMREHEGDTVTIDSLAAYMKDLEKAGARLRTYKKMQKMINARDNDKKLRGSMGLDWGAVTGYDRGDVTSARDLWIEDKAKDLSYRWVDEKDDSVVMLSSGDDLMTKVKIAIECAEEEDPSMVDALEHRTQAFRGIFLGESGGDWVPEFTSWVLGPRDVLLKMVRHLDTQMVAEYDREPDYDERLLAPDKGSPGVHHRPQVYGHHGASEGKVPGTGRHHVHHHIHAGGARKDGTRAESSEEESSSEYETETEEEDSESYSEYSTYESSSEGD
jgi:hypothetical protein